MLTTQLLFTFILLTTGLLVSVVSSASNPYEQGPLGVTTYDVNKGEKGLVYDIEVTVPTEPGKYPIIILVTAFAGNVPVSAYTEFMNQVTSHGFIVVGIYTFPSLPFDKVAFNTEKVMEWCRDNIDAYTQQNTGNAVVADFTRLAIGGHSAGGKMAIRLLQDGCQGIKAAILLDPVDGEDPWGILPYYVIHPPQMVNFTIPTLVLGSGYGPVPLNGMFPACAPKTKNFPRFFNAMHCPIWSLNATEWGHGDFLDPFWLGPDKLICSSNPNKDADYSAYRAFMAGAVTAFAQGKLNDDCSALKYITDTTQFPVGTGKVDIDTHTSQCDPCTMASCVHD